MPTCAASQSRHQLLGGRDRRTTPRSLETPCRPERAPANPIVSFSKNGWKSTARRYGPRSRNRAARGLCHARPDIPNLLIWAVRRAGAIFRAGVHRAYNVITGELAWTFHTIPQPGSSATTLAAGRGKYAGGVERLGRDHRGRETPLPTRHRPPRHDTTALTASG
jgi:hypothetical protein